MGGGEAGGDRPGNLQGRYTGDHGISATVQAVVAVGGIDLRIEAR
jgi:hypothetical protein